MKVLVDAKKAAHKVWIDALVLYSVEPVGFAERYARSVVLHNAPVSKINELSFLFEEFEAVSNKI
jgi:hypothetical protein